MFSSTGAAVFSSYLSLGAATAFRAQCTEKYFNSILPEGASTIEAARIGVGGSFGQGATDTAYTYNATNLPASCGIIVNVTSSATSAHTFGLILPKDEMHPDDIEVSPFYRPEPAQIFRQLPHLKPDILYLFGEPSPLSSPAARQKKIQMTGTGVGGSGGLASGRVQESILRRGHTVSMELVQ